MPNTLAVLEQKSITQTFHKRLVKLTRFVPSRRNAHLHSIADAMIETSRQFRDSTRSIESIQLTTAVEYSSNLKDIYRTI